jgi:hypothetical protein
MEQEENRALRRGDIASLKGGVSNLIRIKHSADRTRP